MITLWPEGECAPFSNRNRSFPWWAKQSRSGSFDPQDMLTIREREILQLAAEGHTNSQIAAPLHISQRTAENHRAHLMHKLGLQNHSELVRHAARRGLIPL